MDNVQQKEESEQYAGKYEYMVGKFVAEFLRWGISVYYTLTYLEIKQSINHELSKGCGSNFSAYDRYFEKPKRTMVEIGL